MKKLTVLLLFSSLVLGAAATLAAQEHAANQPPKILNIVREYTKPGKSGSAHEKTEAAFVQAMRAAKSPTHYLAADSMSGQTRSLFFTGFDSFEAMEKDMRAVEKNPTFAAALDRAGAADGELLSETDAGDFVYREEYSLRPVTDIPHMRYFEISLFRIKPGHEKDWDDLVKMYISTGEKIPDAHWVTYEAVYGQTNGTFIVFTPMKSASEIDHSLGQQKQWMAAFGEEGMKKLGELSAKSIESTQTNLFAFNPRMSYVSEDWVKADPDFWAPKTKAAPKKEAKKSEESEPKK